MDKKILATNIDGFLIKHEAFIEPHRAWFDRAIRLTGDESLEKWKGEKDYFVGVDKAMEKIMPNATPEQRTIQARTWYQEDVLEYIKTHPEIVYKNVVEVLKKLKNKFKLVLITTNSNEYINKILEAAKLENIYDIVFAISVSEKPNKASLFEKFIKKYGQPDFYIAGKNGEVFDECLKLGTFCIYVSWDDFNEEIANIANKTIKVPEELELI